MDIRDADLMGHKTRLDKHLVFPTSLLLTMPFALAGEILDIPNILVILCHGHNLADLIKGLSDNQTAVT